jgi:acetyl-CoA carboxylase biotin carboxyl carrier protein
MNDDDRPLESVERAARELLPQLTERLARYGLGEIEVRHRGLRLRVAAGASQAREAPPEPNSRGHVAPPAAARVPAAPPTHAAAGNGAASDGAADEPALLAVPSPGVGYFVFADGLGPGLAVEKGQPLGWVEVLGVRHDVRAPRGGTVRNLVAESGEPVEYGQVVIEIEPAEGRR